MKSVMISIRPEWCALIASGRKTIEVRKTRPVIGTPFRCYIYQCLPKCGDWNDRDGKIIAEFMCDDIKSYPAHNFGGAKDFCETYWMPEKDMACLSHNEICAYGNGKTLYGWHISKLEIYDRPRELGEFCGASGRLQKPPQSWCYVREVNQNGDR